MNKLLKNAFFACISFALSISVIFTNFSNIKSSFAKESITSQNISAEIVMEVNSKRVLHEKNINNKMFMASTTKILTAITIIENLRLDKKITVSKNTTGIEGSSIYLEEGEILSVRDLLYGLMLRSGNDCAETLAVACSGSINEFAKLMNKTAQKIGAKNSNFVNPHGLHDENHYTTAYDLALISTYAIKNKDFLEIVSTKKKIIPFSTRETNRVLINKNKMLGSFEGATGIKTGYTKKAGRCLVTSAKRGNLELVSVVLNCYDMWRKSTDLLNNAFNTYEYKKLVDKNNFVDFISNNSGEKIGVYVKDDIYYPLKKEEDKAISFKFSYKNFDKAIKKDTEVGKIDIYLKNNLIFSKKTYNIIDIKN